MWSWRERYSKRRAYFNPLIQHFVEANPPRADGKGLYERSRYFVRGRQLGGADEDDEEDNEEWEAVPEKQAANQQRASDSAPHEQPRRQRQSEPGPLRRREDDNMQPPPRKRARHTAPLRRVSSVEQARGSRRARHYSPPGSDEEPWEASSVEEDAGLELDKDVEYGCLPSYGVVLFGANVLLLSLALTLCSPTMRMPSLRALDGLQHPSLQVACRTLRKLRCRKGKHLLSQHRATHSSDRPPNPPALTPHRLR